MSNEAPEGPSQDAAKGAAEGPGEGTAARHPRDEAATDARGGATAVEPAHSAGQHHAVTEVYEASPRVEPAWAPEPPAAAGPDNATALAAPTPPARRGNRGAGILIAILAAIAFAVVDALVVLAIFAVNEQGNPLDDLLRYIATPAFWATAIVYALALFLLVAIANRGGWWWYVLGGFLVAVVVYFAYIAAVLLTNALALSPGEVGAFVARLWAHPLTIATAVVAREVTIWFGAWIAARGRRVAARNAEARQAFDNAQAVPR